MMRFSIGMDDFKRIRTEKDSEGRVAFYCDKSLIIKNVIDDDGTVIVLPRPKRFGKTLNLSMLKYFFDNSEDNAALFNGLKIAEHENIMKEWQGKYPVIFISFKDLRSDNYQDFITGLKKYICECHLKFRYLLDSPSLADEEKHKLKSYHDENFKTNDITESLWCLTQALYLHHGKQEVVVLLDEYDTPLQDAYVYKYFDDAIKPFRLMMGKTFKSNEFLYKGVITGITRIARESLFSGVNNLRVYDITTNRYASYFGFTEDDIKLVCDPAHLNDLKSWYNGYTFGDNLTIYNPWSILNFLSSEYKLEPYWINTSSNDLIKESLTADKMEGVKELIAGKGIDVAIEPFTVMDNLKSNKTAFWNLLLVAGFLTLDSEKRLRIPNKEIQYFFEKVVLEWFGNGSGINFLQDLLVDFIQGHIVDLQTKLQKLLIETMSFHDVGEGTQESFYHGFLLGLMLELKGRYIVKSNRESGYGRYDIALYPNNPVKDSGVIIEVKMNKESVDQALTQIQDKEYATELRQHGCKIIHLYGIHFNGKQVTTRLVTEK